MVKPTDLTGKVFGTLTVIRRAGSNKEKRALWLCLCICGEERIAVGKDLLSKKTTRCLKKCILTEDLVGQRIGNLIVISQEGSDKHDFRQFRCKCLTPLKDLLDERMPHEQGTDLGYCNREILINAVALKQDMKPSKERKIPKSCFQCSRILSGKAIRMATPMENLAGLTFGRLTAIRQLIRNSTGKRNTKRIMYECSCSCGSGRITQVRHEDLIGKSVRPIRSCGCLQREWTKQNKPTRTHGLSNHPLYDIRLNIIRRCYDETCEAFDRYGGRGIIVCDEWLKDVKSFYNWAMNNGWEKGLTIDRIHNDGNYSPQNCEIKTRIANVLKMHRDHGTAFFVANMQVNINELSCKSKVSANLCKKLLSHGYPEEDVFAYGRLPLHQKNAVSRAIHKGCPINMKEASRLKRIAKLKPKQSSEMGSYRAMMARCYNPNDPSYKDYGAKGIKVCPEWKNNPKQFLQDMGPKPKPKSKYAIDRYDSRQDYSPHNCRWLTKSENSRRVLRGRKNTGNVGTGEIL